MSFQLKVFALSFCVLVVAVTAIFPTAASDSDSLEETSIPESRTFKTKHVKHLPLLKKHKKVGGWLSHLFSKTPHTTIPTHYEVPPTSIYKVHRYQGIELKPISTTDFRDVSFQTSGPVEESHSYEPPSNDFETFSSADHHLPVSTPSTIGSAFSSKDKPVFTSQIPYSSDYDFEPISVPEPAQPIFAYAPQFVPIAKPFFTSVYSSAPLPTPPPLPPALTFVPHSSPNPTVLPSFPIKTPDVQLTSPHQQITAWSPALSFKLPVVHLSLPPVVAPVPIPKTVPPQLSSIHHTVVVPSNSAPHSHVLNIPDKFVAPALTTEAPVLPSTVLPPTHSPLPLPVSTPSPTPFPSHSLLPNFMPTPPSPHAFGSYLNHDFPYPPSNVPISSHLKDSSLTNLQPEKVEIPHIESVSGGLDINIENAPEKVLAPPKFESGIFQKLKDWKSDKASAALSHFNKFKEHKHLMTASFLPTAVKAPVDAANFDIPKPIDSTFIPHLPESIHPPTANPPQVHFPLTPSYFEPLKYENFPPNFVQSPLLFNSYGVPIPQDTYAPPHFVSHDRVSSASEEKSSVLPAPSILDDKLKHQDIKEEIAQSNVLQQPSQIAPKFLTENFQKVQLQPAQTEVHPVYKPKPSTSGEEDVKSIRHVAETTVNPTEEKIYSTEQDLNLEANSEGGRQN